MKKRTLTTLALALLTATATMADSLSEAQAQAIAAQFIAKADGPMKAKAATAQLTLASQTSGHYAYNIGEGGGFVIIAADDNAANTVLGYADNGTFSEQRMPDNVRWWLEQYDRQVAAAARQEGTTLRKARASRKAIAPMLTTTWSQDSPYNDQCPTIGTTHCYAGCVATAIAQVMNYYEWPVTGTGSKTYTWKYTQNGSTKSKKLTANFANSTYDWANMADTYGSSNTTAEKNAVAKLISDVGIAVEMEYDTEGSGASDYLVPSALHDYFGYNGNLALAMHDYYSASEWEDMIYAELAASRPCYYSGASVNGDGGHAFVCDGYNADGYYHFNWGWGGYYDGYYLLSALAPESQGIGGNGSNFNYYQSVVTGIAKTATTNATVFGADSLYINQKSGSRSTTVRIGLKSLYNFSVGTPNVTFGVRVENTATGESSYIKTTNNISGWKYWTGYSLYEYPISMATIPSGSGTYRLHPAVYNRDNATWSDIQLHTTTPVRYITLTASYTTLKFSDLSAATLSATSLTSDADVLADYTLPVTATVKASGDDYVGEVYACLLSSSGEMVEGTLDNAYVDVANGESQTLTFNVPTPSTAGTYYVALLEVGSNDLSVMKYNSVTVKEAVVGKLTLSNLKDVTVKQGETATFSFTAKAGTTSDYYGMVYLAYFSSTSPYPYIGDLGSTLVNIGKGKTATISLSTTAAMEPGKYIYGVYNHDNEQLSSTARYLTVEKNTSAIASPIATKADGATRIYTLDGKRLNATTTQGLPRGLYIVKQGGRTQKVSVGK